MTKEDADQSRRNFLVKVAYTAPIVATLTVMPSVASAGSANLNGPRPTAFTNTQHKRHHHNGWKFW